MLSKFKNWFTDHNFQPPTSSDGSVFDISPDYDQPVFTGARAFERNCEYIERLIGKNKDILFRKFTIAGGRRAAVAAVDGMYNKELLERSVILASRRFSERSDENKFEEADSVEQLVGSSELSRDRSLSGAYLKILSGDAMMIVEGEAQVLIIGVRFITSRSVGESPTEGNIRGPHEAFIENIRINTALLRRRITDPNLTIEALSVGQRSHTAVGLCYILGLTDPALVDNIRQQLEQLSIDIVGDSGKLEQLIHQKTFSIFPQCGSTELTDTAADALAAGRVVILVNGSPHALILPVSVSDLMTVSEDNYRGWLFAGFVRLLRWVCVILAIISPAAYVAIISYHPGLLPIRFLLVTALNRANVPFSAVIEILLIEFTLEILREASIRMPQKISSALSIVGGIIIGDATINAGLVSPFLIIVAALSTLSIFVVPSYSFASSLRAVKYFLIFCASVLGIFGLTVGGLVVLSRFAVESSSGMPLSYPFAPAGFRDYVSEVFQMPESMKRMRSRIPGMQDRVRMGRKGGRDD